MSHSHLSDFYFSQVLSENVTFSSREWQMKSQGTNKGREEYHQWLVEACEDADNNDYWRPDGTICPTWGTLGEREFKLSQRERRLLAALAQKARRVVPQDALLEYIYRVALERFQLLYLLGNNLAFRNAGWARSKR